MSTNGAEHLQPHLAHQEQLLWCGRPAGVAGGDWFGVGCLFLFTVFTGILILPDIIWVSGSMEPAEQATQTRDRVLFMLVAVAATGCLLFGLLMKRRATVYGLTTRRVLISTRRLRRRVQSLPLAAMRADNVRLQEHSDWTGTIRFDDFGRRCGEDGNQLCSPGFERILNAPQVFALIREVILHQEADGAGDPPAARWGWAAKNLDPDREPVTRLVLVWLEVAAQLTQQGDESLAAAIQQAMDGRPRGHNATVALTVEEQRRVNAVLQDGHGDHDPD